jgi:hypothetical protein
LFQFITTIFLSPPPISHSFSPTFFHHATSSHARTFASNCANLATLFLLLSCAFLIFHHAHNKQLDGVFLSSAPPS